MLWFHTDVFHDFMKVFHRELTIKPTHQCYPFFPGNVLISNLLRSLIRGASKPELDIARVVVKAVHPIIKTIVLAICPLTSHGVSFETAMLHRIVVTFLWCPLEVVAQVVHLNL